MISPDDIHERLNTDLEYYIKEAPLLIKDKNGVLVQLRLNRAQRYVHAKLEEQLRTTGRIRALVVKGRQQGISTYVSARYYHGASRNRGTSVFILSHDGVASGNLFRMVKRYHGNTSQVLRAEVGASNRFQLILNQLDSDYTVGTAGNDNVGRGGTAQKFHGSEAAYWVHAEAIQDAALESIVDLGTEIILESTANGPVGLFYDKCMKAIKKKGDYILIFVPWFWQEEYEREDDGSELSEEEQKYVGQYLGEFDEAKGRRKILWRRAKIIDFCTSHNPKSGPQKFKRIYPSNPIEAFQATGEGLINAEAIMDARKATISSPDAPLIMGVDPAGDSGGDRTIITFRRGRKLEGYLKFDKMKPMKLAGICARLIDSKGVDKCFIDVGYGYGTIDRLHELGYKDIVCPVAFNEGAMEPDIYRNKRSEMIIAVAEYINGGDVSIPDDDELHADLACIPIDEQGSDNIRYILGKKEIKKLLGRSPDIYDAFALTFAYPVRATGVNTRFTKGPKVSGGFKKQDGPLKTLNRFRGRRR